MLQPFVETCVGDSPVFVAKIVRTTREDTSDFGSQRQATPSAAQHLSQAHKIPLFAASWDLHTFTMYRWKVTVGFCWCLLLLAQVPLLLLSGPFNFEVCQIVVAIKGHGSQWAPDAHLIRFTRLAWHLKELHMWHHEGLLQLFDSQMPRDSTTFSAPVPRGIGSL